MTVEMKMNLFLSGLFSDTSIGVNISSDGYFVSVSGHVVMVMMTCWMIGPLYNVPAVLVTSIVGPEGSCVPMAKWPSKGTGTSVDFFFNSIKQNKVMNVHKN